MSQISDLGSEQDPHEIAEHLCIHHKIAFDLGPDWKERWKIPEDISKIPQRLALGSGKEDFIKVFEKPKAKQSVAVVQINEEVNVRNLGFP